LIGLGATSLAIAAALDIARASVGPAEQRGTFALLDNTPKIVSEFWAVHGAGLTATLKIRQFGLDASTPIRNYDLDMQRLMHLIVVRDDFATFAHLHPDFDAASGTFSQNFTKEPHHRYYLYADTEPHGMGQQVFRFTIESDGPIAASHQSTGASPARVGAGPYTVALGGTTLGADRAQSLDVNVLKSGKPARDLGTYLGAAAHAVFINTSTLTYVHVHPTVRGAAMAMATDASSSMSVQAGPNMQMSLPALPAGTYKLWLQFRGAPNEVYTAPFTILVR
jgi:hypothetical protein